MTYGSMVTCAITYALITLNPTLVFAAGPARPTEFCKVRPIAAPELMGRGSELTLPDGRTLAVIGHEHGPREVQGQLLTNLLDPKLNGAELARANKRLRSQLSIALTHFTADLKYLKKATAGTGAPLTVWAEGGPENTAARIGDIKAAAERRRIRGSRVDDDLLLASGSPAVYLAAATKLPLNVKVEGLEQTTDLTRDEWARSKELRADAWSMERIAEESLAASRFGWNTFRELDALAKDGKTEALLKFDLNPAHAAIDRLNLSADAAGALKKRLAAYLFDRQSAVRRDIANVDAMLTAGTGGLFLVGDQHRPTSLSLLTERCRKLGASPPKPTASPDGPASPARGIAR